MKFFTCIRLKKMFLPEELVLTIREYTKPVFQHFREYNAYLRTFPDNPLLKSKLYANDQEVVNALKTFLESEEQRRNSGEIYEAFRSSPDNLINYRAIRKELYDANRYDAWWAWRCHHALTSLVYGRAFHFWDYETAEEYESTGTEGWN